MDTESMSARIYDIKTGTCVLQLDHSGVVYNEYKTKGIDGIHFYKDGKFIGYNKKTNNWEEMGRRPYQINFSMWFFHRDVLPLATIDCVEENSVVTLRHFDWSSGHLTSKNFQPINDNVMGFDYLILSNLKTTESQANMEAGELRIAEKLIILNDRSLGMLARIYNVKKACADAKSKPKYLQEKSLESATAHLVKKFPSMDLKRNSSAMSNVDAVKSDIMKNLSLYYYTFVELLDLKDHILQLLTQMDANQIQLDITVNYDVTSSFLTLMSNFVSLMILLGRIEERKAILALYNAAYELSNQRSELSFPRLGQMIIDYDNPVKKLVEDFAPINRLVQSSLRSLYEIYLRRNISAEQLRNAGMISLIATPQQMIFAALTNTVPCEYLSIETMDKWIIFGTVVCHTVLLQDQFTVQLFHKVLEHTLSLQLFRDEPLLLFPWLISFFEGHKGSSKRIQELKQMSQDTSQSCGIFHLYRRQFIRNALREMAALLHDQPGLLGPKVLFVWMGLSFARDEVLWLLRHADLVNVNKKLRAALENVVHDRCLAEILFYMAELRQIVTENMGIISTYYRSFMYSYDSVALRSFVEDNSGVLATIKEEEGEMLRCFVDCVSGIKEQDVRLDGLRMDWFRIQANTSFRRSRFQLKEHKELASLCNSTVFHTKMIDAVPEMITEVSDLSIYCFYPQQFEQQLKVTLNFPAQSRYSIAFVHVTCDFVNATHNMCPEEKDHIMERAVLSANASLEMLSKQTARLFDEMLKEEHQLSEQTSPRSCAQMIAVKYYNFDEKKSQPYVQMPGYESHRQKSSATELTELERRNLYLVELCQSLKQCERIKVVDHLFHPKAFLQDNLEVFFMDNLVNFTKNTTGTYPKRPSEVMEYIRTELATLQRIDDCLNINVSQIFNDALLQQTQPLDSLGRPTVSQIYYTFYSDLLHKASLCQIMYSDHFKSFVSSSDTDLQADQFTDAKELRALAQIIGPYGVKYITEKVINLVSSQIGEIMRVVRQDPQREILKNARVSYSSPDRMRELIRALSDPNIAAQLLQNGHKKSATMQSNMSLHSAGSSNAGGSNSSAASNQSPTNSGSPIESVLQRVTIIGEICAFRDLIYDAMNHCLQQRMPFLLHSLEDLVESNPQAKVRCAEICAAAGMKQEVDMGLVAVLRTKFGLPVQRGVITNEIEREYSNFCLCIVFIAVALPFLSKNRQSIYRASLNTTENNCHTISKAISTISGCLFAIHSFDEIPDRMREFLALASRSLLQSSNTADPEATRLNQSLYILLEQIVKDSPWLNYNLLESCFPYALVRSAYLNSYRAETLPPNK
ncbi:unnamed protein product [Bursaphelenchus okinawaensis]|uniref:Uncharacterized protein n=1 Tax=Bursaphelenchus okinawaensis TaxID=465554 RepID=A0A811KS69_9BILA|nr:unnamed protein product [Bursaphelenchus okinawaensis]CAG9110651.1 unnamed protein product [Bursaphelenchus okinawaensis]